MNAYFQEMTETKEELSLIPESEYKVSSVLDRNVKEYGKQFMFDNNPETCWNSDNRSPQWIMFKWACDVEVKTIIAQFQVNEEKLFFKNLKGQTNFR